MRPARARAAPAVEAGGGAGAAAARGRARPGAAPAGRGIGPAARRSAAPAGRAAGGACTQRCKEHRHQQHHPPLPAGGAPRTPLSRAGGRPRAALARAHHARAPFARIARARGGGGGWRGTPDPPARPSLPRAPRARARPPAAWDLTERYRSLAAADARRAPRTGACAAAETPPFFLVVRPRRALAERAAPAFRSRRVRPGPAAVGARNVQPHPAQQFWRGRLVCASRGRVTSEHELPGGGGRGEGVS